MANTYDWDQSALGSVEQLNLFAVARGAELNPGTEITGITSPAHFDILAIFMGANLLMGYEAEASEEQIRRSNHDIFGRIPTTRMADARDFQETLPGQLQAVITYPSVPSVIPERRVVKEDGTPHAASFAAIAQRIPGSFSFLRCHLWLQQDDTVVVRRRLDRVAQTDDTGLARSLSVRPHARIT